MLPFSISINRSAIRHLNWPHGSARTPAFIAQQPQAAAPGLASPAAHSLIEFQPSLMYAWKTSYYGNRLYCFLNKRWLFDKVFNEFIVTPCLNFGYTVSYKTLDKVRGVDCYLTSVPVVVVLLLPNSISITPHKLLRL
eukprot:SM000081S22625  [mRNA]  locus=s81:97206:97984:+ [translate_table: standard]